MVVNEKKEESANEKEEPEIGDGKCLGVSATPNPPCRSWVGGVVPSCENASAGSWPFDKQSIRDGHDAQRRGTYTGTGHKVVEFFSAATQSGLPVYLESFWREKLYSVYIVVNCQVLRSRQRPLLRWEGERRERTFTIEEERGFCRSFLTISHDPISNNCQHNTAFWDHITLHYNHAKAKGNPDRPSRSLESKWGAIKHDVAKFCGAYKEVFACQKWGWSIENVT